MTLLLPAADKVVREAVDAVLDGRKRPGAGTDISFATKSSRYRVIHGVLREATDSALVGARFIGWLFDGGKEPYVSDRWAADARAVLLDEPKGQIIVSSITRVHVENALPPEALELPATQLDGAGFPQRAGTLHGMAAVDHAPLASEPPPPAPLPAAGSPIPTGVPTAAAPDPLPPRVELSADAALPPAPQQPSPMPKRTIPPAPPIPGRQMTPVPAGAIPRPPTPPHPGSRTAPMPAMQPAAAGAAGAPPPPAMGPLPRAATPRTYFGLGPATQIPPPPPTVPGGDPPTDPPLPQFDLDDMDIPTRADPHGPPPSSEDGDLAIPLVPRGDGSST